MDVCKEEEMCVDDRSFTVLFLTGCEGEGRQLCVLSRANVSFNWVHTGRPHADQHLSRGARGDRAGHGLEHARIPKLRNLLLFVSDKVENFRPTGRAG